MANFSPVEDGPLPPHERTWRHPSELGPPRPRADDHGRSRAHHLDGDARSPPRRRAGADDDPEAVGFPGRRQLHHFGTALGPDASRRAATCTAARHARGRRVGRDDGGRGGRHRRRARGGTPRLGRRRRRRGHGDRSSRRRDGRLAASRSRRRAPRVGGTSPVRPTRCSCRSADPIVVTMDELAEPRRRRGDAGARRRVVASSDCARVARRAPRGTGRRRTDAAPRRRRRLRRRPTRRRRCAHRPPWRPRRRRAGDRRPPPGRRRAPRPRRRRVPPTTALSSDRDASGEGG